MENFEQFNISSSLMKALSDLNFERPTPIQEKAFSVVKSGKNLVGIAQTGTGKTLAFLLPILQDLKYSEQYNPRVLILVPTRELVLQMVENVKDLTKYMTVRVEGVYGGTNINTQKKSIAKGVDIVVATPGRLYDLVASSSLKFNDIKKVVIDEVDVMLDLGFRFQLANIFDLLPQRRQNLMFSATMTEEIDTLIRNNFIKPEWIAIAISGTPLKNIHQRAFPVQNFYTKVNLLQHLLEDAETYSKVLVFTAGKKKADKIFSLLEESFESDLGVIHSNKSQNYRIRAIRQFEEGTRRILLTTDVMARGLDLDKITHIINFDTPSFPENYMHRIGRTGRAEEKGESILFFTPKEEEKKLAIEDLMGMEITIEEFPEEVPLNSQLLPEEKKGGTIDKNPNRNTKETERGAAFHEKKEKNKKTNQGGKYKRIKAFKYNKPKTRGDRNQRKKRT